MTTEKNVLTKEIVESSREELEQDFPIWDNYTAIDDDAAELLAQIRISYLGMKNLRDVSDAALKLLSHNSDIHLNDALKARALSLRVSIQDLRDAGFFAYVDASFPSHDTLSYGGEGLDAAYQVKDQTGKCHNVKRAYGADVEELVEAGFSWFSSADLSHLGIDLSVVEETVSEECREWYYKDLCYPITGSGIGDSSYARAAFALVAILNAALKAAGSDEQAYGVNEGNAFGIVFLTEPLRAIIESVVDDESMPVTQEELEAQAQVDGEPPLVKVR